MTESGVTRVQQILETHGLSPRQAALATEEVIGALGVVDMQVRLHKISQAVERYKSARTVPGRTLGDDLADDARAIVTS